MKLGMGLLNVPTVANSWKNLVNLSFVRIFYPVYGMGWDKGLVKPLRLYSPGLL
ncbi:hypothetical protein M2126_001166 [Polynucleobacter sphagniphilus]|jgi:hypothetical protein|uniref:Uncharacterized protein n=1 Tax=Polynucleobacter sphagniphilus TaxID=1743169 RepID=A0AA43S4Z2_9BURK|nr:hypothetical protein [Polynucleobacter sphagniphilus]MDH6512531.1 hypothetical protein [Polynucleobacter sphagniphilus]